MAFALRLHTTVVRGRSGSLNRRRVLSALFIAGLLAAGFVFASVVARSYDDVSRDVETSAANMAVAVARDIDRNIELLDLSIQAVGEIWGNPAVQALDPKLRATILFDYAARAQTVGTVFVFDATGVVRANSRIASLGPVSFADRDYFRVHIMSRDVGLFVSKPFVSRITGKWQIALSRRINDADGAFAGVVAASLELDTLNKLYDGLKLGMDGSVTLFRTDGTVITREPYAESEIRLGLGWTDGFGRMRSSRQGSFEGPSPVDGQRRIISFHRVGTLPLIQDVEVSVDQAYADWWRRTLAIAAILGVLGVSSVALLLMLNAELARRAEVEAVLERLVATDPLTELANRRRFEEGLHMEWRRAIRDGLHLSVIMIDADRFKAFNDTYGHPAGDLFLKALAGCITANIRRPGDLAARYGGEEFVVLLPSTDAVGALKVAEEIRSSVLRLAQPHAAAPDGIASVSIGVASTEPMLGQSSEDVVASADGALYRAKADGRNCVRAAAYLGPSLAPGLLRDLVESC